MPDLKSDYETVNLSVRDGVARIELNRPETLNAWNSQFGVDLLACVHRAAEDEDVRSVLITGAGRGFSSGADLRDLGSGDSSSDGRGEAVYQKLTEVYHPIMEDIRTLPKPVVAAVNGPAVGIGCSLALCCDLIVAAESAYFLLAFVNIGLVPDGGSSLWLPTRIGLARATELCMLGERLPAAKALEWGLINRVVADEQLASEAESLAARLAAGPTRSYAGTKRQLNHWLYTRMDEQLELEAQIQREMTGSSDSLEGAMAFIEKRQPRFSGR
jgi:2-(1,2-epoxy-1,2-dihydrophenyl)acetyl-CoA isomerase